MKKSLKTLLLFIAIIVISFLFGKNKTYAAGEVYNLPNSFTANYETEWGIRLNDSTYPYGIFCGEHKKNHAWGVVSRSNGSATQPTSNSAGGKNFQRAANWTSEAEGNIPNMVGYAFYLAENSGYLDKAYSSSGGKHATNTDAMFMALQDIIWTSKNDPLINEQVAVKGEGKYLSNLLQTESGLANDSAEIEAANKVRLKTRNYAEVYYRILRFVGTGNVFTTNTADGEAPKVFVDQATGKYTVGPYKTTINPNVSGQSVNQSNYSDYCNAVQYLYDSLASTKDYSTFASFDGFENVNSASGIEILDRDGNAIAFPNFIPGQEKEYYIRFTPANSGAICELTSNHYAKPNFKITYMNSFNGWWKRYYCSGLYMELTTLKNIKINDYASLIKTLNTRLNQKLITYSVKTQGFVSTSTIYNSKDSVKTLKDAPVQKLTRTVTVKIPCKYAHGISIKTPISDSMTIEFTFKYTADATCYKINKTTTKKNKYNYTFYYKVPADASWKFAGESHTSSNCSISVSSNHVIKFWNYGKYATAIKNNTQKQVIIRRGVTPNTITTKEYFPNAIINMELQGNVWIDQKAQSKVNSVNGIMDSNEIKFRGIQVSLYQYATNNGSRSTSDTLIATTTTDRNGKYWFFGRKPGTNEPLMNPLRQYYVVFTYNGQLYQDTYYKDDLSGSFSNAQEVDEAKDKQSGNELSREELNNRFYSIHPYNKSYYNNKAFAYGSSVGLNFSTYWENFVNANTFRGSDVQEPSENDYYVEYNRQQAYTYTGANSEADQYIRDCMINSYTGSRTSRTARYPSYDKFTPITLSKSNQRYYASGNNAYYGIGYNYFHYLYTSERDQARYVNLGLFVRQQSDLALQKDIYKATLLINGQKHEYNYNEKDAQINNDGDRIWTVNARAADGLYNDLAGQKYYDRAVRSSDYLYDDELGSPYKPQPQKNLQVYVTYRIAVKNLGSVDTKVDEIVDYYDSKVYEFDSDGGKNPYNVRKWKDYEKNVEYVQSYVGDRNGNNIGNVSVYENSNTSLDGNTSKSIQTADCNYQSLYISGIKGQTGNEWLAPGDMAFVYLTFKVKNDPNTNRPYLDEELTTPIKYKIGKRNIAEINAYSTKYTAGQTLPDTYGNVKNVAGKAAGIVDFNSNAGNLSQADLISGGTRDGRINYEVENNYKFFNPGTLSEEGNSSESQVIKYKHVENDTDQAPNFRLLIDNSDDSTREFKGYVFEDNRTKTVENSMIGDGKYNNKEDTKINGVTIRLIELSPVVDANGMPTGQYHENLREAVEHIATVNNGKLDVKVQNNEYYSGKGSSKLFYTGQGTIFDITPTSNLGQGEYSLKSLAAGNYYIEFKYGDTNRTTLTNTTNDVNNLISQKGMNAKSYNGQDYKSTIYQTGIDQKAVQTYRGIHGFTDPENQDYTSSDYSDNYDKNILPRLDTKKMCMYDINLATSNNRNNIGISDAKDSYYRRQANIAYSSILKNHNSEVLDSFERLGQSVKNEQANDKNKAIQDQISLIKELEDKTYMESKTGVIDMEVEFDGQPYKINDIDLGLQERPLAQLMLNKQVTAISVVLPNGQTLFDTSKSANNLYYAQHAYHVYGTAKKSTNSDNDIHLNRNFINTDDTRLFKTIVSANSRYTPELIQGYIDDELMEGSKLTVHYLFRVKNVGEVDYKDRTFYYTGQEYQPDANISTTNPDIVIDYLANEAKYDQTMQENGATWIAATSDDLVPSKADETKVSKDIVNNAYYDTLKTYNSVLVTKGLSSELKPTCYKKGKDSESTTTLISSADMSMNSAGDNLVYNNLSEIGMISNSVGRKMQFSIVGNQKMADQSLGTNAASDVYTSVDLVEPSEVDADSSQKIIFMPPTGANKNYLPMIIAVIIAMGFVIVGAIIVKRNNK